MPPEHRPPSQASSKPVAIQPALDPATSSASGSKRKRPSNGQSTSSAKQRNVGVTPKARSVSSPSAAPPPLPQNTGVEAPSTAPPPAVSDSAASAPSTSKIRAAHHLLWNEYLRQRRLLADAPVGAELDQQLDQLRRENAELKGRLEEAHLQGAETALLRVQNTQLELDNKELRGKAIKLQAFEIAMANAQKMGHLQSLNGGGGQNTLQIPNTEPTPQGAAKAMSETQEMPQSKASGQAWYEFQLQAQRELNKNLSTTIQRQAEEIQNQAGVMHRQTEKIQGLEAHCLHLRLKGATTNHEQAFQAGYQAALISQQTQQQHPQPPSVQVVPSPGAQVMPSICPTMHLQLLPPPAQVPTLPTPASDPLPSPAAGSQTATPRQFLPIQHPYKSLEQIGLPIPAMQQPVPRSVSQPTTFAINPAPQRPAPRFWDSGPKTA